MVKKTKHQPPRRPTIVRRDVERVEVDPRYRLIIDRLRRSFQDDVVAFLHTVSTLVFAVTPPEGSESPYSLDEAVAALEGLDAASTTAALHALAVLIGDDALTARVESTLQQRTQPMPSWLTGLDAAEVVEVVRRHDEDGIAVEYMIEVHLGDGTSLLCLVEIVDDFGDLTMTNGFLLQASGASFRVLAPQLEGPGITITEVDQADAGAELSDALQRARSYSSDQLSWPASIPLVAWIVALLPDGEPPAGSPAYRLELVD